MRIVLGTKGSAGYHHNSNLSGDGFLKSVLGSKNIRYEVGTEMLNTGFDMPASPFLQAAFYAFAEHHSLKIEPAYFWATILQEVATMVKLDPQKYAYAFNGDPSNKKVIKVICDELLMGDSHWPLAIERFREQLANETGKDLVEGFLPHFSSDDATRELAYLVSVMDAASPFFKYEVHTRCGIPEIHLEGTLQDWGSLYKRVVWLEKMFGKSRYFDKVKSLIDKIGTQINNNKPDVEFWKSLFKYQSMSGGDTVSGWITDLYAYDYTEKGPVLKTEDNAWGYGMNRFPSGLSVVPFTWVLLGEPHPMRFFSGFTGLIMIDDVLEPVIGYGVIEGEK
jgi:hypothetical protein